MRQGASGQGLEIEGNVKTSWRDKCWYPFEATGWHVEGA
jgi:hypothetical protein